MHALPTPAASRPATPGGHRDEQNRSVDPVTPAADVTRAREAVTYCTRCNWLLRAAVWDRRTDSGVPDIVDTSDGAKPTR